MRLRTILGALFLLLMLLSTLVLLGVKHGVILRSFAEIEQGLACKDIGRVIGALEQEEAALRVLVTDWGIWDDSYAFIQDGNQQYIDSNLLEESFYSSKFDLLYFVNNSGRVVWGRIHDISQEKDVALRLFPPGAISPDSPVLNHPEEGAGSQLLLTENGPLLIATIDLQPSSGSGESHGIMVMGRFLSADILARLATQTKESFQVWPLAGVELAPEIKEIVTRLGSASAPLLVEVDDSLLRIYSRYGDQPDKPGLLIQVVVARDMMAQVRASLAVAWYIFGGVGLFILLVAYGGVHRWVLRPLQAMDGVIGDIQRDNDLARRLPDAGALEMRSLIHQFNGLLGKLEEDSIREKEIKDDLALAKQKAEQATATKAEFLANMSHEIRTPMNGIIGLTELVQRTPLNVKQQGYLKKIANSSQLLLAIINDILDFSKIEAGKMSLEKVPFAMQDVLDNLATAVSLSCEEKGLELLFDVENVPAVLLGDPLRLGQILINLGSNAVKFTDAGQVVVKVRCQPEADSEQVLLQCSVQDSGIGLSAMQIKNIFKSFSQADSSTSRKYGGSGLGLTICTYLVEQMGGDIWVDSSPGEGSTFSFTSRLDVHASAALDGSLCPDALKGYRALVVDDNPVARRIHGRLVTTLGFKVKEVSSGAEAVAWLAEQPGSAPCQVVLLDWKMADMDGIATAHAIQDLKLPKPPKIIMVSAYGRVEEINATAAAGIAVHLLKPVTAAMLCETIKDVVGGSGTGGDNSLGLISSAGAASSLDGFRVMVVDDVEINQLVAKELLEQAGCQVVLASNGLEAIALARDADPALDVIMMDIQMPGIDGYETTSRLRALPARPHCNFSTLPIIAMTANIVGDDDAKFQDVGMSDYLAKPIKPEGLLAMVEKWGKK